MGCDYDDYCRKCGGGYFHKIWCHTNLTRAQWFAEEAKGFKEFTGDELKKMSIFECPKCKCLVADVNTHITTHYKSGEI